MKLAFSIGYAAVLTFILGSVAVIPIFSQSGKDNNSLPKLLHPIQISKVEADLLKDIEGPIVVTVSIRKDGSVSEAELYSGPMFRCDASRDRQKARIWSIAERHSQEARFSPPIFKGKPSEATGYITLSVGNLLATAVDVSDAEAMIRKGSFDDRVVKDPNMRKRATKTVVPRYPPNLSGFSYGGDVRSNIIVDENGKVQFAGAIEGWPEFQDELFQVLCLWEFSPFPVAGRKVKTFGTLSFYFKPR